VEADTHRNRLLFRSWLRGTQECDLLLGAFADDCLASSSEEQLLRFRFQLTSALSILHRLTGIALAVGSILLSG
jgi:succinate dehydrogenase flavin-adding protein (antitoxin of CptAB toxin-antitoxin module)